MMSTHCILPDDIWFPLVLIAIKGTTIAFSYYLLGYRLEAMVVPLRRFKRILKQAEERLIFKMLEMKLLGPTFFGQSINHQTLAKSKSCLPS